MTGPPTARRCACSARRFDRSMRGALRVREQPPERRVVRHEASYCDRASVAPRYSPVATFTVSAMRRVPAPPAEVYAILADYTEGHPHILPSSYFRNIEVEEGGVGAGTRIRFDMT